MRIDGHKEHNISYVVKKVLSVVIGTLILAFATTVFILPKGLIIGGMSGLGIILDKIIPFEFMTAELIISVLTWITFFLGLIFLGKQFAIKTLVSTITYPLGLALFSLIRSENFLGGFFVLDDGGDLELLICAVFGGIIIGLGCAVTFIGGGSTGGTDIIALIICKYVKNLKSSLVIGLIDGAIVVIGVFFTKDLLLALLGVLAVMVCTIVIDKVFVGANRAFVAEIVTERAEELSREIITSLNRTTTVLNAIGGYSNKEYKLVKVSFSILEYSELLRVVNKVDKKSFTTIHLVHEITGEGW